MLKVESSLFLPMSAFSARDIAQFGKNQIVRAILFRPGEQDNKFLLHERPDWSGIAPLLRQYHGGKIDIENGETHPRAVKRELKEELGLKNENRLFLGMSEFGGWLNYYYLIFRVKAQPFTDKSGQVHKKDDRAGKKLDTRWFDLDFMLTNPELFAFNHVQVAQEVERIYNPIQRIRN